MQFIREGLRTLLTRESLTEKMEYFSEWFLIHRTPAELLALTAEVQPRPRETSVEAEPSGINLFLLLRR